MSLIPAKYKFTIWKGSTFRKRITLLQGAEGSAPEDLTDYTAILEIKNPATGAVLFTLSTANARIVIGGLAGTIDLVISAADTAAITTWTSGTYDLKITAPAGGDTDAVLFGSFIVKSP